MGGGISTIVDLAILSHSITVEVTLTEGLYVSDIHCAAFPAPSNICPFSIGEYRTVSLAPNSPPFTEMSYTMPSIEFDMNNNPIQGDTEYVIKCRVDVLTSPPMGETPIQTRPDFMCTNVRTPVSLNMCETGVMVNGVMAPRVRMNGQSSLTLSGLEWSNFHASMVGMHAYEVPYPVLSMSEIKLTCCAGEECEFFFALYNCEACTGPKPAGLAETLRLDGWDSGACSPEFGGGYKTTAFHKSVNAVNSKIEMTFLVPHYEIMSVYGLEGSVAMPWCKRPHGPVAPGPGCGANCPMILGRPE